MKILIHYLGTLICLFYLAGLSVRAQTIVQPLSHAHQSAFAIVVDDVTYQKAEAEIKAYRQSLEARGLSTYIVSGKWESPDQIRKMLKTLYNKKPRLEGAALVGDIPVPMIRDAQHLTSTFKMSQQIDWKRSSVPSDRYYDDFDLVFNFIRQDSTRKEYFYYSLAPESPQYIQMDIYTGRIKPPEIKGRDKFEAIKAYLTKASGFHLTKNTLDQAMIYSGYGYHSESHNAWAGEQLALREQIPGLFSGGGNARFLNFRTAPQMKSQLLSEVQRPDLDLAIFHTHGDDVTQLINGVPQASNPSPSIDNIRKYLRSKVQAANEKKQNVDAVKKRFHESMQVPYSWMADALIDSVRKADSLYDANNDITTADLAHVKSNVSFLLLDACDNGSFHLDDYIAGRYAFGSGSTAVVYAASIGVLQDQWANQGLGLLSLGVRSGNWLRQVAFLESHLFGDPAFAFTDRRGPDLNNLIVNQSDQPSRWKPFLADQNADVQALALQKISALKPAGTADLLKNTFDASPFGVVRLMSLNLLSPGHGRAYTEVLKKTVNDPCEMVRRIGVTRIGSVGSEDLLPALVSSVINDRNSERVNYNARNALAFFDHKAVEDEVSRQLLAAPWIYNSSELSKMLMTAEATSAFRFRRDYGNIASRLTPIKERKFNIRTLRAYSYHQAVPSVIDLALNPTEDLQLRIETIEALSWFDHSYRMEEIKTACQKILTDPTSPSALKVQARKTSNILTK